MLLTVLSVVLFCGFSHQHSFPKPLPQEEEQHWLQILQTGSPQEQKEAKDQLILHNLRLVAHIVKKYTTAQKDAEELISIGTVGLIKAIRTYDTEKNTACLLRFPLYRKRNFDALTGIKKNTK